MKFVIAPNCLERNLHQQNMHRLVNFFEILKFVANQYNTNAYIEWTALKLSKELIDNCNLLVISNRVHTKRFSDKDINLIENFVKMGGNLLLMSNHAPSLMLQDNRLARRFGFSFGFANFETSERDYLELENIGTHPLMLHPQTHEQLKVSIHSSCFIEEGNNVGEPLIYLNDNICDYTNTEESSANKIFSYIVDRSAHNGKIAAIASTDIIGEPCIGHYSTGLNQADNRQFICNLVNWLVS